MKNLIRLLCLLLAAMMFITVLASCGSSTTDPGGKTGDETSKETQNSGSGESETKPEELDTRIKPDIPTTYSWGSTLDVLCWEVDSWRETVRQYRDIVSEGINADLVNDAVYERNGLIKENYGVEITQTFATNSSVPGMIENQVTSGGAGDDAYEVVYPRLLEFPSMLNKGLFVDLNQVEYIDLEKPWWDQDSIESLSIMGTLYLTATAINVNDKDATAALAFSKKAAQDRGMTTFYDDVANYEWTYDKLMGYCEEVGNPDTNGNGDGVNDAEDFWGFLGKHDVSTSFFHGSGARIIRTNEDGEFEFALGDDRDVDAVIIIGEFMNSNYFFNHHKQNIDDAAYTRMFETGHGLFFWMRLDEVTNMRSSEVEFGILPIPMLEEEQKQYYSTVSQHTTGLLSIPNDNAADRLSMTGMVLEALAADSYYGLQTAYVDLSLKTKYSSDEESRESLGIILSSRVFDPGLVFNFGTFGDVIQGLGGSRGSLTTAIATYQSKIEGDIEKLMDALEAEAEA